MRSMICALVVALACGPAAAEQPSWFAAESGSVRVISNDSAATATRVLDDVLTLDALLQRAAPAARSHPLRVFALKDSRSLAELSPPRFRRGNLRTFGFSYTGPDTAFIALRTDRDAALTRETLAHEYVHTVTASLSPDAPAWLDEGLAEFWSAMAVDGDRAVIGRPVAAHIERLRTQKWIAMDALLAQSRESLGADPDRLAMFYAQSWLAVHYLLLGDNPSPTTPFMPSITAMPPQFEATLRQYVSAARFREVAVPHIRRAPSPFTAAPISDARSLAERANMLLSGEAPDAAVPLARRALAINPNEPLALEVMGAYYFVTNQPEQARDWLGRALASGDGRYTAALYLALLSTSSADRERYLSDAIRARPDSDVAWQRFGAIARDEGRLAALQRWCAGWKERSSWAWFSGWIPCGA